MSRIDLSRARDLRARVSSWRSNPALARLRDSPPGQLATALYEINLRDRALTLAGQAFIALIPLLVVLATWTSSADATAVGDWLIDRFALTGPAAAAVTDLFQRPPATTAGISILGMVLLLLSVNSFASSVQRTFEAAWGLPGRGSARMANGWGGALVLIAMLTGLAYVSGWVRDVPGGRLLVVAIQVGVAVPAWWALSWLMLSRRLGWWLLLPGAMVSGVAQVLTTWGGSVWVPHLIERNALRYGVVGVAVALVSWLVVLAFIVVGSAVVGAWAGPYFTADRRAGPP